MSTRQFVCSIIIPTRNRRSALLSCLGALAKQTRALDDVEVIICDDGSSDGTAEAIKQWHGPFAPVLLRNENSQGFAQAKNRAFAESGGDIILYLSDDAILSPYALELHLTLHGRHKEKRIAVSGSYRLFPHQDASLFRYVLGRSDLLVPYPAMQTNMLYGYQAFYTYNISLPRAAHDDCGIFDEDFCSGGEDQDFGCRLQNNGYKVLYANNCFALAGREYSLPDFLQIQRERGAAEVLLYTKHPELPCGFARMGEQDVLRLKEALVAVEPAMHKLVTLMGEVESLYAPIEPDATDKVLLKGADHRGPVLFPRFQLEPQFHQLLWQRRKEELSEYLGRLIKALHFFRENTGDHIGQLLDAVSFCGYFLQAYYKAAGMAETSATVREEE